MSARSDLINESKILLHGTLISIKNNQATLFTKPFHISPNITQYKIAELIRQSTTSKAHENIALRSLKWGFIARYLISINNKLATLFTKPFRISPKMGVSSYGDDWSVHSFTTLSADSQQENSRKLNKSLTPKDQWNIILIRMQKMTYDIHCIYLYNNFWSWINISLFLLGH